MKRFAFPKSSRLVTNRQFKAVLEHNLRFSSALLTMFVAPNHCSCPRLGVSIGKSFGNAVIRNRLKRLVRETFRQNRHRIPQNFDYLLMISPLLSKKLNSWEKSTAKLASVTFDQIQASFLTLAEKVAQKL